MGDYGCYCFLESSVTLTLEDSQLAWGSWVRTPPQSVPGQHGWGAFHAKDNFGFAGSEGWVIYKAPDGARFTLSFACPFSPGSKDSAQIECTGDACKNYGHRLTLMSGKAPMSDAHPEFSGDGPKEDGNDNPVVVIYTIYTL